MLMIERLVNNALILFAQAAAAATLSDIIW